MRRRPRRFRQYAGAAYFLGLIAAACLLAWDATVRAHHEQSTLPADVTNPRELACETHAHLQLLGSLPEASGLALSRRTPQLLWSMNDSADPVVVPLSTSGVPEGRVRVTGATVKDWEDLSIGPCAGGSCLYVADIGNAGTKRTQVTVYRVPEPKADDSATSQAEAFDFNYPDGGHDAEASFVTSDGTIFIITKGHPTVLYRAPRDARPGVAATLVRVADVPVEGLLDDQVRKQTRITDAETSPDGHWVALRTNAELLLYRTHDLIAGRGVNAWHADLRPLDETQGEGVALSNDGDVYLAGEGGRHGLPGTFARIHCTLPK